MFDVPLDAWYAWFGVAAVSLVAFAAVGSLPTAPPPDASGAADVVDSVAASDYPATGEYPLDAAEIRLGPSEVGLRNDAGESEAAFAFGPVTPVVEGSRLQSVLHGVPPRQVFDSKRAFRQAVIEARTREPTWRPVERTLVVRTVAWGGFDVTLVGA